MASPDQLDGDRLLLAKSEPTSAWDRLSETPRTIKSSSPPVSHHTSQNGSACKMSTKYQSTANGIQNKYTDGKGFLHYAMPISEYEDETQAQDDNISCASSFKMDSDILSLENAEFALQTYNNNCAEQTVSGEKYYAASTLL